MEQKDQDTIQQAMYDAAVFERQDNRSKDAARLVLLKEKGMKVIENPDIEAFRTKVANLKDMDLYQDPEVKTMLSKMIEAVK